MTLSTLISAPDLHALLISRDVLVLDCRVDLADRARGPQLYAQGHIPGAVFADLETDLSDLSKKSVGRHPLPDAAAFSTTLSRWGWTPSTSVVAYDAANGALAAARVWWMFRLIGHDDVAILDGGFAAWEKASFALDATLPTRAATSVARLFDATQIVYTDELQRIKPHAFVLDARATPRYRGDVEPIDPVAGHVPGAHSRPYIENLSADGTFKSPEILRSEFTRLLQASWPRDVIHMCGSGVTACHNLLAMEHAGLHGSRVYAPSWSGWISDRSRPIATGSEVAN